MTDLITIISPIITTFLSSTTSSYSADQIITNGNITADGPPIDAPIPVWLGFIGCLVASVFFGSNLVPVKQFSAGDGLFFQFIFCVAVYIVGLIVDLVLNNQRFYPLVLIGGIR
jgi:hypothetical protein